MTDHFVASDDPARLYERQFIASLFNDMSGTYGLVNVLSSFGFCVLWRRQCVRRVAITTNARVLDLMSGMGEVWPSVWKAAPDADIVGVDLSDRMCELARRRHASADVLCVDALDNDLPSASFDAIVCSFGLKTLSQQQQRRLALEVDRLLKPGGHFSAIEISVPTSAILRWPFMAYLHRVIPPIGRLCLGNPDCYRMLGRYTERFGSAAAFASSFSETRVSVTLKRHFFGCATSVAGTKAS